MPSEEELSRLQEQYGEMLGKKINDGLTPLQAAAVATFELFTALKQAGFTSFQAIFYIGVTHGIANKQE